jgi:hypothetical protein
VLREKLLREKLLWEKGLREKEKGPGERESRKKGARAGAPAGDSH